MKGMGQPIPDEEYEDTLLRASPAEYKWVLVARCKKFDINRPDVRHMVSANYVDYLFHLNVSKMVAGHGVAMQTSGGSNGVRRSDIKCLICGEQVAWKEPIYATQKAGKLVIGGDTEGNGGGGRPPWCPLLVTSDHDEDRGVSQKQNVTGEQNGAMIRPLS